MPKRVPASPPPTDLPARQAALDQHVRALLACRRCPLMESAPVSGGPVLSRVMLIGQAPGVREPGAGRPFAWTAGRTMFKWFLQAGGVEEALFRQRVYMAAVCRCFPGKKPGASGDRVPNPAEVTNCYGWMREEFRLLDPLLIIPVGKLAIGRFLGPVPLETSVGRAHEVQIEGVTRTIVPLPHPSGASPWPRMEPGRALTNQALAIIVQHPAWREAFQGAAPIYV